MPCPYRLRLSLVGVSHRGGSKNPSGLPQGEAPKGDSSPFGNSGGGEEYALGRAHLMHPDLGNATLENGKRVHN